jgi:hypothetical protein
MILPPGRIFFGYSLLKRSKIYDIFFRPVLIISTHRTITTENTVNNTKNFPKNLQVKFLRIMFVPESNES